MKVKHMTFLAMYTTIALTIFVVEAMLPPLAPIPGIKLGLANVVTLWLLYYATWKDALCASEKCCVTARTQKCRQKYSLKNRFRSHRRICCESIWSKRT